MIVVPASKPRKKCDTWGCRRRRGAKDSELAGKPGVFLPPPDQLELLVNSSEHHVWPHFSKSRKHEWLVNGGFRCLRSCGQKDLVRSHYTCWSRGANDEICGVSSRSRGLGLASADPGLGVARFPQQKKNNTKVLRWSFGTCRVWTARDELGQRHRRHADLALPQLDSLALYSNSCTHVNHVPKSGSVRKKTCIQLGVSIWPEIFQSLVLSCHIML